MAGKPLGIGLAAVDGAVVMRVTPIDRVADEIWDAVRSAVTAGWTPERFLAEVRGSWAQALDDDKAAAMKAMR